MTNIKKKRGKLKNPESFYINRGKELINYISQPDIYTLKSFAIYKEIVPQTLYDWAKRSKFFADALVRASVIIEQKLIKVGMEGDSSKLRRSDFCKFLLQTTHGHRLNQGLEISGDIEINLKRGK